jgi:hypothetical protein
MSANTQTKSQSNGYMYVRTIVCLLQHHERHAAMIHDEEAASYVDLISTIVSTGVAVIFEL